MAKRGGDLKAAYTIPELAQLSGLSRWRVRRLLKSNGVVVRKNGSDDLVMLSDLKRDFHEFWDSILDRLAAKAYVEEHAR